MYTIPVYRFDRTEKRSRTRQILGTTAALAGTAAGGYAAFRNRGALMSAATRQARVAKVGLKRAGRSANAVRSNVESGARLVQGRARYATRKAGEGMRAGARRASVAGRYARRQVSGGLRAGMRQTGMM
jgi:hypothetical protein